MECWILHSVSLILFTLLVDHLILLISPHYNPSFTLIIHHLPSLCFGVKSELNGKWQMAPWFYRALESVSIALALSSALTIYACHIWVHQTLTVLNSNFLQLGRRSGGRPPRTVYPRRLPVNCETQCVSGDRTHNLPIGPTRYQLCYRNHSERRLWKHRAVYLQTACILNGALSWPSFASACVDLKTL